MSVGEHAERLAETQGETPVVWIAIADEIETTSDILDHDVLRNVF